MKMFYIRKERCTWYQHPLGLIKHETGESEIVFMDSDESKVKSLYNSLKKDNHFIWSFRSVYVKG